MRVDTPWLDNIQDRDELLKYLNALPFANLFLVNIDNFSSLNTLYGFNNGDRILDRVISLLDVSKPPNSRLFRVVADEFAIVCSEVLDSTKIVDIAKAIISFFDQIEINLDEEINIRLSISMGIAAGSSEELLIHAKEALSELREHSRGAFRMYDKYSTFIKKMHENYVWIDKIKEAFESERLFPYFQPIYNNQTNKIEKYECLARIGEEDVVVPPIRFMEASKLTGTLSLVTRVMIERSFAAFSNNNYMLSINITNTDLYLNYLEEFLLKHSRKYNINPNRVILEILEDIESLSSPEILSQLNSLRKLGFKIAIDDFGSSSSNLSRLLEFSPDYLKIDGIFIKDILTNKNSLIIVEAVVHLCKKSNIKMIAEFVHSLEVQQKVVELGIEYSQGYFIGKPTDKIL